MSGRYDDRYNARRPNISFRVSPEIKDQLLELQDGSDKTIGEIAENVMTDALTSSNKNHGINRNPAYSNGYKDDITDGRSPNNNLYDDGFKEGYKNGSNHVKKEITKRMSNPSKTKDDVKKMFKQFLEDNKDECPKCGGTFIDEGFDYCPYCTVAFDTTGNDHPKNSDTMVLGMDTSNIRIPILSDITDYLGLTEQPEDKVKNGNAINFVGGNKSKSSSHDTKEYEYECSECGAEFNPPHKHCPDCGVELLYD